MVKPTISKIATAAKLSTAVIAMASLASSASSAVLWCNATILAVAVTPSGVLYANFNGMGEPFLCTINAAFIPPTSNSASIGSISTDVCKTWYAGLVTAMVSQRNVTIAIDFGTAPTPTCSTIPVFNWAVPNPYPYWIEFDK